MKNILRRFPPSLPSSLPLSASLLAVALGLSACAMPPPKLPPRLDFERSPQPSGGSVLGGQPPQRSFSESATPPLPKQRSGNVRVEQPSPAAPEGPSDLTVSLDQLPLPTFVHAVYGGVLKANYSMDSAVAARTDLVTFRTAKPQSSAQMAALVRLLLKSYGIAVQDFGGVVRIVPDNASSSYNPAIRRGRAHPDVPATLRPVFHYVELEATRVADFSSLLRTMFGTRVSMVDDPVRNAIMLSGQPDDVAAAMEAIQVFDQPAMRGQRSKRVSPVFWTSDEFARRLSDVLAAEGYSTSTSISGGTPILVMSVPPINSVIIFASSEAVLEHALKWARDLDRPSDAKVSGAYFTYAVKYADAQLLAKTLSDLMSPSGAGSSAAAGTAGAPAAGAARSGSQVVVNNATNTLIIKGGGPDDYRQWMTLLAELDRPTKSAVIDVLVAEVSQEDAVSLEGALNFRQAVPTSGSPLSNNTRGSLGAGGFVLEAVNAAGLIRARLTAAQSKDGVTRVLSSPKLVARNGETATIQVGDEVPILTSQQSGTVGVFGAGTPQIQTVQYRSTGAILKIRPIINSGNRIDLDVSQEVSTPKEASTTGGISSPTISTRKIDTKLSLQDGETVMLAGMISNSSESGESGVPYIKDIPLIGNAFKSSTRSNRSTEMIILITPYVINDDSEARAITEAFQNSLGSWAAGLRERSSLKTMKSLKLIPSAADQAVPTGAAVQESGAQPAAPTGAQPPMDGAQTVPAQPVSVQPASAQPGVAPPSGTEPEAVAPPPAVSPAPARRPEDDGVIMSKPSAAPAPLPSAPGKPGKPAPAAAAGGKVDPKVGPAVLPPPGGKQVQDQDLLEEIRRAVERR